MTATETASGPIDTTSWPPNNAHVIALVVVVVVGALVRFVGIDYASLTSDEASTFAFASQTWGDLWGERALIETNPPIYYSIQKIFMQFGGSEFWLRLPSAIFGTLAIIATYALARLLAGSMAGLFSASLIATAPYFVLYSQNSRGYALVHFAATLAVWGLTRLLLDREAACQPLGSALTGRTAAGRRARPGWLAYFVGTVLVLYAHNTTILLPALATLIAFGWWAHQTRWSRHFAISWFVVNLLILLIYSWWMWILVYQAFNTLPDFWIPEPTIRRVIWAVYEVVSQRFAGQVLPILDPWVHAIIPAFCALGLWMTARRRPALLVPAAFLVGIPAMILLISLWQSIWMAKVLIWPLAFAFVYAGIGMAGVRPGLARWLVLVFCLTVQAVGIIGYHRSAAEGERWRDAAQFVAERIQPGEAVVFLDSGNETTAFAYYFARNTDFYPMFAFYTGDGVALDRVDRAAPHLPYDELASVAGQYDRLWTVESYYKASDNCPECLAPIEEAFSVSDLAEFGVVFVGTIEPR